LHTRQEKTPNRECKEIYLTSSYTSHLFLLKNKLLAGTVKRT
jgi:hypothetical protein